VLAGSACPGCESAHYVVRNPDRGVVAIPRDTPELRAKAEKLMHDQFPGGFVIDDVRAVAIAPSYRTVTRIGPVAEVQTNQRHEVLLSYHAGQPLPVVPVQEPAAAMNLPPPPGPLAAPTVSPISATVQPGPLGGLPAQPVPINR
jgi:hypothetical protein